MAPSPSLKQIAYVSSTIGLWTPAMVQQLLAGSRERNAKVGITGILLYRDGNILHIFEGAPGAVDALFSKIEQDQRHSGLIRLYEKSIDSRDFPHWSMGYREVSEQDLREIAGLSDALTAGASLQHLRPSQARRLIESFKDQDRGNR